MGKEIAMGKLKFLYTDVRGQIILACAGAFLAGIFFLIWVRRRKGKRSRAAEISLNIETRVLEARKYLKRAEREVKVHRFATDALVVLQIAAGLLVTGLSLFGGDGGEASKSKNKLVPISGMAVVVASSIRPFFSHKRLAGAMLKRTVIRAIVRNGENLVYKRTHNLSGAPSIDQIRRMISSGLTKVDIRECKEMEKLCNAIEQSAG
jgi:hypothetical protein